MIGLSRIAGWFLAVCVFVLCSAWVADAGVVAEMVRYTKGSAKREKFRILMSENKLKFDEQGGGVKTIFNLNTGEIIYVDVAGKTYTQVRLVDFVKYMKERTGKIGKELEAQLSQLPPEKRAQIEEMMKAQGQSLPGSEFQPMNIKVKDTGVTDTIAGYKAQKFEIYEDGKLHEELWISREDVFKKEFDMKKLSGFFKDFRRLGTGRPQTEGDKMLDDVYGSGFPLKTVTHMPMGGVMVEEVSKITKAGLAESEFLPPKGYRRVPMEQMMGGLGK
ncbi:MAG: DUF4412 domain-containing protein [Thermodesulfobacteriota bacterium]